MTKASSPFSRHLHVQLGRTVERLNSEYGENEPVITGASTLGQGTSFPLAAFRGAVLRP